MGSRRIPVSRAREYRPHSGARGGQNGDMCLGEDESVRMLESTFTLDGRARSTRSSQLIFVLSLVTLAQRTTPLAVKRRGHLKPSGNVAFCPDPAYGARVNR